MDTIFANPVASRVMGATGLGGPATDNEESLCPSLTFKQRMFGCGCCVGLGLMLYVMSWVAMMMMDITFFCVLISFANIVLIAGLMFLAGPVAQMKRMFDESRIIATVVFILALVGTILVAVLAQNALLVILLGLVQMGAMVWYYLSYIPFARDALKACLSGIMR